MFRVMVRDDMSPIAKEILEATGRIEVTVDNDKTTNKPEALAEIIKDFDGLAVRSGTKVNLPVFDKASKLKVVARAGIGVDNIDVAEATKRGIVAMNAPGGNTITTAEHAIAMMLAMAREIPQATASMKLGKWEKKKFLGVEITGKILGIVGLGNIGREVAIRAKGLKMQIVASDPYITKDAAAKLGVELIPLDELFSKADFISMHVPKLEETKNLIRKENIEKMKRGVRIINCARGEIVDLNDLYEALESGHVAAAALDVFPEEPPQDMSKGIFAHPNVVLTPHLGASTDEAQVKVAEMIAHQMADYLINDVITNAVNFPSISMQTMEHLRPFLQLGERMGSFIGQIIRQPNDITITYSGETTTFDTHVLTNAILKGLFSAYTDKPINYVNAPAIAKAKGVHLEEITSREAKDYTNLISIKFPNLNDELDEIRGTVFSKKEQRIVRLGNINMDAIPKGWMIVIRNYDRPGVIGNIGSTLAKYDINIARFHLGNSDGKAICIVNIDHAANDQVISELKTLPNIIDAKCAHLD